MNNNNVYNGCTLNGQFDSDLLISSGITVYVGSLTVQGKVKVEQGGTIYIAQMLHATGRVTIIGNLQKTPEATITSNDRVINTGGGSVNQNISGDYVQGSRPTVAYGNSSQQQTGAGKGYQITPDGKSVILNGRQRPIVSKQNQRGFWVEEEMFNGNYYENPFFVAI